jgi:hypothetical protein
VIYEYEQTSTRDHARAGIRTSRPAAPRSHLEQGGSEQISAFRAFPSVHLVGAVPTGDAELIPYTPHLPHTHLTGERLVRLLRVRRLLRESGRASWPSLLMGGRGREKKIESKRGDEVHAGHATLGSACIAEGRLCQHGVSAWPCRGFPVSTTYSATRPVPQRTVVVCRAETFPIQEPRRFLQLLARNRPRCLVLAYFQPSSW